ncbi:MAG: PD-(D/E)XK nuclease domain-containing protein, partial [Elusimicrobiota bacterium]|nr:PD-(D/E)XK nuclease domain-containing protein [Elusimicrobiota bacterium]
NITYTLEMPNVEVREAFISNLFGEYSGYAVEKASILADTMREQAANMDAKEFEKSLKTLFAQIPYKLYINSESYYHTMFLLMMSLLGFKVQGERETNLGKIDAVWEQEKFTLVMEIKYSHKKSKEKLIEEAMEQIKEKRYYESYMNKPVILIAIGFSAKENKDRLTEIGCKFEKIQ